MKPFHWLLFDEAFAYAVCRPVRANRPEELFEVKGKHFHLVLFAGDDDILDVFVYAQERTGLDVVVLAVFHQLLDRFARDRETLYLVEYDATSARNQRDAVKCLKPFQRAFDVVLLRKRLLAFFDEPTFAGEVDED